MKKTIAWILALAMLSVSTMALAENNPPPQMAQGENGQPPEKPDGDNGQPPEKPDGENGQPPEMPDGQKPGNPPDGGMGGAGGKPESYDAVTTVSEDAEIAGETIESTGGGRERAAGNRRHGDGREFDHRSRF